CLGHRPRRRRGRCWARGQPSATRTRRSPVPDAESAQACRRFRILPRMTDATERPLAPGGPTRAPTSTRRAVLNTIRGSAGNLVEWYDVYVYTVFATYFEAQFFDKNDT